MGIEVTEHLITKCKVDRLGSGASMQKNMYRGSSQHGTTNAGLKKSNRQMNFGFDLWRKQTLSSLFLLPKWALGGVSAPKNARS